MKDLTNIKLIVLDCDGVLSDGKITYDNDVLEVKNFSAKDGLGIKLLAFTPIKIAIITGRESHILRRRCDDLGIELLFQKVRNKKKATQQLLDSLDLSWENLAYMGDDWNDFPAMKLARFSATPADACEDFKAEVDLVCNRNGGDGAVREMIEYILKNMGLYEKVLHQFLDYLENS
jgi:3-deoxy-D-manno-octulosonate 8-phosphate phosphatase (KDO 8-P phosphatase)